MLDGSVFQLGGRASQETAADVYEIFIRVGFGRVGEAALSHGESGIAARQGAFVAGERHSRRKACNEHNPPIEDRLNDNDKVPWRGFAVSAVSSRCLDTRHAKTERRLETTAMPTCAEHSPRSFPGMASAQCIG